MGNKNVKAPTVDRATPIIRKPKGTDVEKVQLAETTTTTMQASPNWAAATDVQAAVKNWTKSGSDLDANATTIAQLEDQIKTAMSKQRTFRRTWAVAYGQVLSTLNVFCNGSAAMVKSFGVDTRAIGQVVTPSAVEGLTVNTGKLPGEVIAEWPKGDARHGFVLQHATESGERRDVLGVHPVHEDEVHARRLAVGIQRVLPNRAGGSDVGVGDRPLVRVDGRHREVTGTASPAADLAGCPPAAARLRVRGRRQGVSREEKRPRRRTCRRRSESEGAMGGSERSRGAETAAEAILRANWKVLLPKLTRAAKGCLFALGVPPSALEPGDLVDHAVEGWLAGDWPWVPGSCATDTDLAALIVRSMCWLALNKRRLVAVARSAGGDAVDEVNDDGMPPSQQAACHEVLERISLVLEGDEEALALCRAAADGLSLAETEEEQGWEQGHGKVVRQRVRRRVAGLYRTTEGEDGSPERAPGKERR